MTHLDEEKLKVKDLQMNPPLVTSDLERKHQNNLQVGYTP